MCGMYKEMWVSKVESELIKSMIKEACESMSAQSLCVVTGDGLEKGD